MHHGLGFRVTGLITCLLAGGLLTSCKKDVALMTPKGAAVVFAQTLNAGDMEKLHHVAVGTDAEFALAKGLSQNMQATAHFLAAAKEKFGDIGPQGGGVSIDLAWEFETSEEKIDGDTATLTPKNNPEAQPFTLKKVSGEWKMDLSYLDKDEDARQRSEKLPQAARIFEDAVPDVERSVYKSFPEAKGAVMGKVDDLLLNEAGRKQKKALQDISTASREIAALSKAIETFKVDNGEYPSAADGLAALRKKPTSAANWNGPYLEKEVPMDPWGHPYVYVSPGQHNANSFDLHSLGPDGQDATADDITNWNTAAQ